MSNCFYHYAIATRYNHSCNNYKFVFKFDYFVLIFVFRKVESKKLLTGRNLQRCTVSHGSGNTRT